MVLKVNRLEEFSVYITYKNTQIVALIRDDNVASYCDRLLWSTVREYRTRRELVRIRIWESLRLQARF